MNEAIDKLLNRLEIYSELKQREKFTRKANVEKSEKLAIGLAYGVISCFLLLYINQGLVENTKQIGLIV